ncbi:protein-lysine N-methyltransferase METTL10-like protein [Leptotrombidium deliense]|uniref:Protein-lysine N-methyltransferase B4U80_09133 n=1 Tax=Leptotrombidium deliense TaxID=299467 RepID=A0A443SP29_9ACAR|nr:protein-lysine N-methyltransferase METTL10-like protein [Leptotrombidium deliense]
MEKLPSSELGTKQYWQDVYRNELECFNDHGERGEVWFGKSVAKNIVQWLCNHVEKSVSIIEIGSGNGQLLMDLSKCGFKTLFGIDYSSEAIHFSKLLRDSLQMSDSIEFEEADFLVYNFQESSVLSKQYDIVIDKGTFDAICLNPDANDEQIKVTYYTNICKYLKRNGLFMLTSCNWTKSEILDQISAAKCSLTLFDEIETPKFTFGGNTGNKVVSLIFKYDV